ncbi:hypothetical protein [Alkalihalobacillus sp. LMS39]|uniref:hypothetical protein n=1 Tax=Alkalihalobacillus sp. LMS39 TaxID=2924032 RepID=UPI001FB3F003|nr:hypothetical protein [Alkalihalobacillus sp. LMS39]UOE93099.1 hypothetical protein MM271_18060 [Alkalihalobacillus sp. LMS39]
MLGMKRNKKNGNTPLMVTLVGVGVGAAAYGLMRGRNNGNNDDNNQMMDNMMQPIQKAMNQFRN